MDAADRTTALTEPSPSLDLVQGAIAQLVERVLCKHEVVGSIPSGSTKSFLAIGNTEFLSGPLGPGGFDIVNEGSARMRKHWPGRT